MKTITLDFETYEQELKDQFKKGQDLKAIEDAKDIFKNLLNQDTSKDWKTEIYKWLRNYTNE